MHNFRPPLDPQHANFGNLNAPQSSGFFSSISVANVNLLSDLIDIGNANAHESEIDAVPDVWARILNFEIALYDETHVLHPIVWEEWCGLLTLIALSKLRNIPLQAQEINLQNLPAGLSTHPFIQSLVTMLPTRDSMHNANPWSYFHLFTINGHPIALSNNQTLVCTSADYDFNSYGVNVNWTDQQGKLLRPFGLSQGQLIGFLNEPEAIGLFLWLQQLDQDLNQTLGATYNAPQAPHTKSLKKLVSNFVEQLISFYQQNPVGNDLNNALQAAIAQPAAARLGAISNQLAGNVIKIAATTLITRDNPNGAPRFQFNGMYQTFNQAVDPPGINLDASTVLVMGNTQATTKYLLLDPAVRGSLNLLDQQIMVYGSLHIGGINFNQLGTDTSQLMGQPLTGAKWIKPEQFFTPYLNIIAGEQAQKAPDSTKIAGVDSLKLDNLPITPILPIQKELLEYLGADYLKDNLSFLQDGSQIKVTLNLRLGTNKVLHPIEQSYSIHETVVTLKPSDQPSAQIWPNFTHPDLKSYYSYYLAHKQAGSALYTLPYHPTGKTLEYVRYNVSQQVIETLTQGEEKSPNSQIQDKHIDLELARLSKFPEALLCFDNSLTNNYVGCLLLKPPIDLPEAGGPAVIGFDLGTSSTNLFMSYEDNLDPVVFHDTAHSLFSRVLLNRNENYNNFLPMKSQEGTVESAPLITLYEVFNDTASPTVLLDGHVKFLDEFLNVQLYKPNIKTDLKWSGKNQDYLTPFFTQLCLQSTMSALQKGARDIEFRFSYPSAFSDEQGKVFTDAVKNAITNLQSIYHRVSYEQTHSIKESVASAYFFTTGQGNVPEADFKTGAVVLDIGGGTTDVSILQGNQGIFKFLTSIKIAGRDLFIDAILRHHDVFFKSFNLSYPSNIQNALKLNPLPIWVYSQIDALIKAKGSDIMQNLPQRHQKLKPMIDEMAIGVAGIFYYIGTVIEALQERTYQGKPIVDTQNNILQAIGEPIYTGDKVPLFYIGGNGAKIFDWFSNGQSYSQAGGCIYDTLFERSLKHDLEIYEDDPIFGSQAPDAKIRICQTPPDLGSKPEVAFGLALDSSLQTLHNKGISPLYISGENFLLAGTPKSYKDILSAKQMPNVDINNIDQTHIAQFIDIINLELNLGLTSNRKSQLLKDIKSHVSSRLQKVYLQTDKIQDECALFIQEVKALLHCLKGRKI